MEVWKDIKGYEGLYQVSDLGRVKSLERKVKRLKSTISVREKILKPAPNSSGYLTVSLWKNNKGKTFRIHYLVAIAFLNHKPKGYELVIDHIDENKKNNNLSNLRLVTNRFNTTRNLKNTSSKYVGVHWHKSYEKWQSLITINGKQIYLGRYDNEYDAHLTYQKALSFIENNENITEEEFKIKIKEWRANNNLN